MKKALFKTGDKVRYIGNRAYSSGNNMQKVLPTLFHSMEATITETHDPEKPLGMVMYDGDVFWDYGSDGYNVYRNEYNRGAIIWPDKADEWELINE